jgi:pyrroline-5-carboxylate reductase
MTATPWRMAFKFSESGDAKMAGIGKIGIIGGGGWLGSAIARSLIRAGAIEGSNLMCSYRSKMPTDDIPCDWTKNNGELVKRSEIVIVSVRPDDWPTLKINARGKLVISVMAGVTIEDIRNRTGSTRTARALPNAAAELGFSYTPYFINSDNDQDGSTVRAVFESCGDVDEVSEERHLDYFTAMSGSGAAFPALLAEAMMIDAVDRGIPSSIAIRAVQQVIIGAGRLQEAHREPPTETVKAFVEYRGTTAAGIVAMREGGFENVVRAGLEAAFQKALGLSGPLPARVPGDDQKER